MTVKIKNLFLEKFLDVRLRFIKESKIPFNFYSHIKKIRNILVITPSELDNDESTRNFLSGLYRIFSETRISTFTRNSLRRIDMNWLGVPNESYLRKLREENFDLVIDINLRQDKICAYLSALSGAGMKLNLANGSYDHIYNLHLRVEEPKSVEYKLDNILNYLSRLRRAAGI